MTMPTPGITTQHSFKCQPEPFNGTILFKGFNSVLRTAWCVAAFLPKPWRNSQLVKPDEHNKRPGQYLIQVFHAASFLTGEALCRLHHTHHYTPAFHYYYKLRTVAGFFPPWLQYVEENVFAGVSIPAAVF